MISPTLRRDLEIAGVCSICCLLLVIFSRVLPTNINETEWIYTANDIPSTETPVVAVYRVLMPDGTTERWELNVVRATTNENGFLQELWLLDRPEAGTDLGRPLRWKPRDESENQDKIISYKDLQLFVFPEESLPAY